MGFKPVREVFQTDSMDDELRNRLWNALKMFCLDDLEHDSSCDPYEAKAFFYIVWDEFFKRPADLLDDYDTKNMILMVKKDFFRLEWYNVYDFIEFVSNRAPVNNIDPFRHYCNFVLNNENSAYRFVGGEIVSITSDEEISEIEDALQNPLKPVRNHLKQALELLADRENPDYRNSIKESISAVESMCKIIAGDGNIRSALNKIRKDWDLHDNLKAAFQNLYSYTSDSSGIRHCMTADPDVGQEEAKFMLVTCSAFVNYLVAKASTKGIDLSSPSPK